MFNHGTPVDYKGTGLNREVQNFIKNNKCLSVVMEDQLLKIVNHTLQMKYNVYRPRAVTVSDIETFFQEYADFQVDESTFGVTLQELAGTHGRSVLSVILDLCKNGKLSPNVNDERRVLEIESMLVNQYFQLVKNSMKDWLDGLNVQ